MKLVYLKKAYEDITSNLRFYAIVSLGFILTSLGIFLIYGIGAAIALFFTSINPIIALVLLGIALLIFLLGMAYIATSYFYSIYYKSSFKEGLKKAREYFIPMVIGTLKNQLVLAIFAIPLLILNYLVTVAIENEDWLSYIIYIVLMITLAIVAQLPAYFLNYFMVISVLKNKTYSLRKALKNLGNFIKDMLLEYIVYLFVIGVILLIPLVNTLVGISTPLFWFLVVKYWVEEKGIIN